MKLFAFSVFGIRHAAKSFKVVSMVGYVFSRTEEAAREYALMRWRGLYPKLKPEQVNTIEVPLATIAKYFGPRALIGYPTASAICHLPSAIPGKEPA